jgi:hypothetical protein
MSVQVNTYVVLGVALPYTKDPDDRFDPYRDSSRDGIWHYNGLCVLQDGMNGEYTVIGRVLAKTENWQPFDGLVDIRALMPPPEEIPQIERAIEELLADGEKQTARIVLVSHHR